MFDGVIKNLSLCLFLIFLLAAKSTLIDTMASLSFFTLNFYFEIFQTLKSTQKYITGIYVSTIQI